MAALISKIPRWSTLLCALVLLSATLAACGGGDDSDDSSSGPSGAETTQAETTEATAATRIAEVAQESGGLSFSRRDLTARAGTVTIALDNPAANQLPHAIEVEGNGVEKATATLDPGRRGSVTADLRPGRYTFYCPVGNHREAGMEGTITVQ